MKFLMFAALALSASASAATTVKLAPGSQIEIEAGDRAIVRCEGSAPGQPKRVLICSYDGYAYYPTVIESGQRLGSRMDQGVCLKAISRQDSGLFCRYDGYAFYVTRISSGSTIGSRTDLQECLNTIGN